MWSDIDVYQLFEGSGLMHPVMRLVHSLQLNEEILQE